ncbi:MAG: leucyl aminopeptidase family protein [Bacteroidales bacterium]|nr:leucyl aminopeptidase family protein [Bacteroidales bacterium]
MNPTKIAKIYEFSNENDFVYIFNNRDSIQSLNLSDAERKHLQDKTIEDESQLVHFYVNGCHQFYVFVPKGDVSNDGKEAFRKMGATFDTAAYLLDSVVVVDATEVKGGLFFLEGFVLGRYRFDKFKTDKKRDKLQGIFLFDESVTNGEIDALNVLIQAVYFNRDLANEPQMTMNTAAFVEVIRGLAETTELKVEVFNKRKIQSLKMGGLLAVNQGSFDDPAFAMVSWKPENAVNEKPYILVGKGVVFDTGGLNIKTGNFMLDMHIDKAGASTVLSAIYAASLLNLPVHVIALLPLTDNRPGNKAFAPGDIITISNGKTVEIVNTDAEGRLILADALSYAAKFDPQLVIDLATLTGSAARAIGIHGAVAFQKNAELQLKDLMQCGESMRERLVEFPLWDDYATSIKSDFADMKNLGGAEAGATTAAKFLENFVSYPWIHIDIAGPAILSANDSYRTKGASGFGTRLVVQFLMKMSKNQ